MLSKLLTVADLTAIPRNDKKIVFTNGCFDLLHEGHRHLLREAKKLGTLLIVGLNTDASVKRLKGPGRPVESEVIRAQKVSDVPEVDHVIIFEEDTPALLIEALNPDVLVKGSDYSEEQIAGAEWVKSHSGRVMIIPLLEGFSTSQILKDKTRP